MSIEQPEETVKRGQKGQPSNLSPCTPTHMPQHHSKNYAVSIIVNKWRFKSFAAVGERLEKVKYKLV